jgi:hypothetical protein
VKLLRLDAEQRELFVIGVFGVAGVAAGLYALVFPALGLLYLGDGYHFREPTMKAGAAMFLACVVAVITAELVVSAAAIRMCVRGTWPGRDFFVGRPAVLIALAAMTLTTVLAVLL